jgi:hypothetical protein
MAGSRSEILSVVPIVIVSAYLGVGGVGGGVGVGAGAGFCISRAAAARTITIMMTTAAQTAFDTPLIFFTSSS